MSYLGVNLRYLRKEKGLTQEKVANKLGVQRSLIGAYEEGRTEPKLQTIMNICHYFGVSIDALINIDISKAKASKTSIDIKGNQLRVLPVVVDTDQSELSVIVPVKAAAGYLDGYGDVDFIENLPRFNLPFQELSSKKSYRLFQISGDSMLPIPSGAYVICEYLQDWNHIRNDECYVLVTLNEGIVYKRVINNIARGELLLKSDNPEYTAYTVKADQVIEVWKTLGYTSFELPEADYDKINVNELSSLVMQLKDDVDRLKNRS